MNGIPEVTRQAPAAPAAPATPATPATGGLEAANSLEALRNHPQFNGLRRLIQSNPAALPAVLQQIGNQVITYILLLRSSYQFSGLIMLLSCII